MNKNIKTYSLCFLALASLASCGNSDNNQQQNDIPEIVKKAVQSLRGQSHIVDIKETITILKPNDNTAIDIYLEYDNHYGYYYGDNEKSFSRQTSHIFVDLDKETGEWIDESIRTSSSPKELYFKDEDDGTVYIEKNTVYNTIDKQTLANYDEDLGVYTPIIFDHEFKNPFDYISYRDVAVKEDGKTLTLLREKADFLAECYGIAGLNFIKDNSITLNEEGQIESITFDIPDLVETSFTRKNTFTVTYQRSEDIKFQHIEPFTNQNPELQKALDVLDGKTNFTYTKQYVGEDDYVENNLVAFFTKEEVFFHQHYDESDTAPYTGADDYDYKVLLNEDYVTYTCYEYTNHSSGWYWDLSMLSANAPYILDSFAEIGPSFMDIDASIFKKIDEKTYEVETALLPSIGKYFDYGMVGCQSLVLDGYTSHFIITLDDLGNIETIDTGYAYSLEKSRIIYSISDIGTTTIPDWSLTVER